MATSAYLERMTQLTQNKMDSAAKQFGLPLNRPMNKTPTGMAGQPMPQEEEEQGPDMNSFFGKTFQDMEGSDKRFGTMFQDLGKLASGLRQEVEAGFMPESIAKQRLQQYVQDSQKWFGQNQAGLMDNPQFSSAVEGMLQKAHEESQGGGDGQMVPMEQEMPQQGGPV
ncbi:MAG: hypothetical protein ACRC6V_15115 [Bacteroidales bacterium]